MQVVSGPEGLLAISDVVGEGAFGKAAAGQGGAGWKPRVRRCDAYQVRAEGERLFAAE